MSRITSVSSPNMKASRSVAQPAIISVESRSPRSPSKCILLFPSRFYPALNLLSPCWFRPALNLLCSLCLLPALNLLNPSDSHPSSTSSPHLPEPAALPWPSGSSVSPKLRVLGFIWVSIAGIIAGTSQSTLPRPPPWLLPPATSLVCYSARPHVLHPSSATPGCALAPSSFVASLVLLASFPIPSTLLSSVHPTLLSSLCPLLSLVRAQIALLQ
ncbi:uncharacterized protein [Sinocyclocheilus grahami]|uniref:uncharacterized protein n=1 Tax=Sinocyclocheilus grahami TaxID=75366 RepID=UPI0007AD68CE|nr:PREDICTED: uncharacterized protein LOC107559466 [Sinocyclocheilus grahami]